MNDRSEKILIVGGGIGGLSTAIALGESGHEVRVVEIQPDLHSSVYGVGIIQPFNALRALDAIGCADRCMELGFATSAWGRYSDAQGNLLAEIPGATIEGSRLPSMNGITRPLLHQILTERALACGVVVDYGLTVGGFEQDGDSVTVTFDDRTTGNVDVVVGADGMRSKVRGMVLGADVAPAYNGQSAFRVNIPREIPGEAEIDRIIVQKHETGTVGFVPLAPDLAYMWVNVQWDPKRRVAEDEAADVMLELMAPWGGLAAVVRDHYIGDSSGVVLRPVEWLIAPLPWHKGRVVLIGDAVHGVTPHMGQGAAQAIEDGIVLARALSEETTVEEALLAFEQRRYNRCKFIVEASVQIGEWEQHPTRDADPSGLTQQALEQMLAPI